MNESYLKTCEKTQNKFKKCFNNQIFKFSIKETVYIIKTNGNFLACGLFKVMEIKFRCV